jgi:hypothetical protein
MTAIKKACGTKYTRGLPQLLIAVIVISICVAGFAARSQQSSPAGAEVMKLPVQSRDFGAISPNSMNEATFVTSNTFADALVIDRVDHSCGCTSATCNYTKVLPGQKLAINAILRANDFPEGISSVVTLHAHAGGRRIETEYHLHGEVESLIEFSEARDGPLHLGAWSLDQLPSLTAVTVTRGRYPLDFDELRAQCDSSDITANVERLTSDSWRISFRVDSAAQIGVIGFPVTFRFYRHGILLPETATKQASVDILGPDSASPSSLLLMASAGQHIRKEITINRNALKIDGTIPEITSVSSDSKNAAPSWENKTQQCVVTIDYSAPARCGSDRGNIIITVLDQGTTYKIKVSYLALIS